MFKINLKKKLKKCRNVNLLLLLIDAMKSEFFYEINHTKKFFENFESFLNKKLFLYKTDLI